jgi:Terminase RNaseH-like domain
MCRKYSTAPSISLDMQVWQIPDRRGKSEILENVKESVGAKLGSGPIFPVSLLPGLTRYFMKEEIPPWARHVVGIDFGFAHAFAAVWLAWTPDTQQYWVIDCFKMSGVGAAEHVRRIHSMTQGLRVKLVYPHDGGTHDKGSGVQLIQQYKQAGANVAGSHVTNYTGGLSVEPSIQEISAAMQDSKITFNQSCQELLNEMRVYHRDAKTGKPVDKNEDLVSALRYCVMGRRLGATAARVFRHRLRQPSALAAATTAGNATDGTRDRL